MGLCIDMLSLISGEANRFIGDMPDIPDNLIAIYETGGFEPEFQMNKSVVERPTFMIKVRDTSYLNGLARCDAIKLALNTVTNITINSHFYIEIFLVGSTNSLGRDDRERCEFSINFKVRVVK